MQNYNIITNISASENSKVALVCKDEDETLYILKERRKADIDVLKHIIDLNADFIPHIYEYEQTDDIIVILEEYLAGKTLRELIEEGNIEEKKYLGILTDIINALGVLHKESPQIIYRDLKPENILITEEERIVLLDFDASREHKPEATTDTVPIGTREYAAPEQYGFSQTDVRSDIYSLGIVMQELASASRLTPRVARLTQKIIRKATMFDPNDRYTNIEMVRLDFNTMFLSKKNIIIPIITFIIAFFIGAAAMYLWQGKHTVSVDSTPQYATYESILALEPDSEDVKNTQMIEDIGNNHCGIYGYPDNVIAKVVYIPVSYNGQELTQIMDWAFAYRPDLKAVIVPESVAYINENVFLACTNLEAVIIPRSVKFITDSAFAQCPNVVIYGYQGTYAEEYASLQRIPFVAIDK